jgi:hypothetical protein
MICRLVALATAMTLAALLAGCSAVEPKVYLKETPVLDLQRYFNGTLIGHGMFSDRGGQVQRRFVVTIQASWKGNVGTLDESFAWSDGETERRLWTLTRVGVDNGVTRWVGTAADVVGEAQGAAAGNALNWKYTFDLKTREGARYKLAFDDWMFLIDDRVMLNRAEMSYLGFKVGEVLISFQRQ